MRLNPRVLALLAAVGVGVYLFAPNLFAAALPLLVLAICPLSMVLMMAAMGRSRGNPEHKRQPEPEPAPETTQALQARLRALEAQQVALRDQLEARAREDGVPS